MKICQTLCYALGIQVLLVVFPITNAAAQPDTAGQSIDSPRQALEVAYAFTGFEEITALLETEDYSGVEVITLRDSTIPFLVDQVYGKPVWQVFLDNVYLDMPGSPVENQTDFNPKEVHILLDSAAGFFVKGSIEHEGGDRAIGADPPAHTAETQLRRSEFSEFSREFPKVSMHEALGAAFGAAPLTSKKISVYLVSGECRGTRLLWHVFSRGIPPRKMLHITSTRNESVVDANTGQWLYSGH